MPVVMTMPSEMFIYLINNGNVGFLERFMSFHTVAEVNLRDLCDLMFGYSKSGRVNIYKSGDGKPCGEIIAEDGEVLVVRLMGMVLHVHPNRILWLMCNKLDNTLEWHPENRILRITNMDEDFKVCLKTTERSKIRCYDCGIPIPEPPEDAHVSERYCDTCYKKHFENGDDE